MSFAPVRGMSRMSARSGFRGSVAVLVISAAIAPACDAQTPIFQVLNEQIPYDAGNILGAGDLDGDGDIDLFTPGRLLANDGSERFGLGAVLPHLWLGTNAIRLVDLNGDGVLDMIATSSAFLGVFLNSGSGTFAASSSIPPAGGPAYVYPLAITDADVDGDGDRDVCVTSIGYGTWFFHGVFPNQPRLFLNDGSGTLTEVTAAQLPVISIFGDVAEFADFDVDGDMDLFFARSTASFNPTVPPNAYSLLLLNNGAGVFAPPIAVPGPLTHANAAVGDLNGDAYPDVVYAPVESQPPTPTASSGVVFNTVGGTFGPFVSSPLPAARVLARDMNGDGLAEVIRSTASTVTVHPTTPGGAIGGPAQTVTHSSRATLAHDFDQDGDVDLCIDGTNRKTLVFNDTTGSLVPIEGHMRASPDLGTSSYPASGLRAVGDVDGDGDDDYVGTALWTTGSSQLLVHLNDGRGNLPLPPTPFCPGGCPTLAGSDRIIPLDFDSDGLLDLYVAWSYTPGSTSGTDAILQNTGSGWTQVATVAVPGETGGVVEGDLDGDGDKDLVVIRHSPATGAGYGASFSRVLFNLGGTFSNPVAFPVALTGFGGVLFDADGDGDLDLAQANGSGGTVGAGGNSSASLFLNNGVGSLTLTGASGLLPSGQVPWVGAGDLDQDGDADLVMGAQTWRNAGNGTFSAGPPLPTATWATDLFDADLDGDLDILQLGATLSGTGQTSILRNVGGTFPALEIVAQNWGFGHRADFDRDGDHDLVGPGPSIYSNTTRQIARAAIVRPGQNLAVDVFGPASAPYFLLAAAGPANVPVPPWGTLFLDPATAFLVSAGSLSPAGTATFGHPVPVTPSVVGLSAYLQVAFPLQQRLTNLEVLTVLGL